MTTPIVLSLGELLWDMLPSGKRAGGAPVNFAYHAIAERRRRLGHQRGRRRRARRRTDLPTPTRPASTPLVQTQRLPDRHRRSRTDQRHPGVHHRRRAWLGTTSSYTRRAHRTPSPRPTPSASAPWACAPPNRTPPSSELLKHTKPGALKFFDINLRGNHYSKELIEELLKAGHRLQDQRRGTPAAARHVRHSAAPPAKTPPAGSSRNSTSTT